MMAYEKEILEVAHLSRLRKVNFRKLGEKKRKERNLIVCLMLWKEGKGK